MDPTAAAALLHHADRKCVSLRNTAEWALRVLLNQASCIDCFLETLAVGVGGQSCSLAARPFICVIIPPRTLSALTSACSLSLQLIQVPSILIWLFSCSVDFNHRVLITLDFTPDYRNVITHRAFEMWSHMNFFFHSISTKLKKHWHLLLRLLPCQNFSNVRSLKEAADGDFVSVKDWWMKLFTTARRTESCTHWR